MNQLLNILTMGRLIKLAICLLGGYAVSMYVDLPVYMLVGFAVFLLVGFDILKDQEIPFLLRTVIGILLILLFAIPIQMEYGYGDEFKYFTAFTGGCMVWFLAFALFKRMRAK